MIRREFAATTDAVRSARWFVASLPAATGADVNTLELLVSELVTNAVLHARSTIVVDVERINDVLRVGVHDSSSDLPVRRELEPTAESGRGLNIVHNLALRWGVDFDGQSSGKPGVVRDTARPFRPIAHDSALASTAVRPVTRGSRGCRPRAHELVRRRNG